MTPAQVPAHKIAAWEAATYSNVVQNLAANGDVEAAKRVCALWVQVRGREQAERLWRDVVAANRAMREAA